MGDELKLCPFCGGRATVVDNTGQRGCADHAWVTCNSCLMDGGPEKDTVTEAIEAWNTRTPASAPDEGNGLVGDDLIEALLAAVRFVDSACGEDIDIGDHASITIYEQLTGAFEDSEYIKWDQDVLVNMIRQSLTALRAREKDTPS